MTKFINRGNVFIQNNLKIYYYTNNKDGIKGSYIICISSSLEGAKKTIEKELNEMGLAFDENIDLMVRDIDDNHVLYSEDGDL